MSPSQNKAKIEVKSDDFFFVNDKPVWRDIDMDWVSGTENPLTDHEMTAAREYINQLSSPDNESK